jgi:hypothetical protein
MRTSKHLSPQASVIPAEAAATLADRLLEQEDLLPPCRWCGWAALYVHEERLDPIFGALGIVERTLKCARCDKLTII